MDILRFITAGNVDDGKSTLIGRLLYDTQNIKSDILASVTADDDLNLAHITDGLRSERQQGITIDVAYKYFTTPNRKYIITDAPGHFQYTKNLVTGASGTDAIIILIDAQNGITDQTRRHSLVASFLKIKQVVVAINKMDLLDYDEQVFNSIRNEFQAIAIKLGLSNATFIPISALRGDNISTPSEKMDWYTGTTLMQYLENCKPVNADNASPARLSVQYTAEGIMGKVLSGRFNKEDAVLVYPAKELATISKLLNGYTEVDYVEAGQNATLYFAENTEMKRGDTVSDFHLPQCNNKLTCTVCWLNDSAALQPLNEYILRINATEVPCTVTEILYKTNINTFEQYNDGSNVTVNQFAKVNIHTATAITHDLFSQIPEMGRGLLIDPVNNYTSAAVIIED